LVAQVNELEADSRRDNRKMKDLENEVFLLRDRVETAEIERDRNPDADPVLPVEVLEPDGDDYDDYGDDDADDDADDDDGYYYDDDGVAYEVVGYDSNGVEIVYAGDATKDESVRPSITLYEDGSAVDVSPKPKKKKPTRYKSPVVRRGDRIPVTSDVPTVDKQLDKAGTSKDTDGEDPREEYKRFYAALRAGNHGYAIAGFRNFIERHPSHDYADNAQYWLGEAYYDKKEYKKALAEFRNVVENYPQGNKVPDSMLKIAFCYEALGKPAKARAVLVQIVEIYPKSSPASLAAKKLDKMEK
jgi:tol-pal system protein YbgF